ncbi:MAG: bifunctional nuclease family protein [Spirochaetes bacterium]|nr:bifunctional nuclease family protein [Spirochaetota bacterium]MBU0955268.1 bifunctional nuclease family protein [Spirochaetota bacterium]
MSANTLVEAEIWTVAQTEQGNVVFVRPKASDTVVPIFIGQLETQAILIALGHIELTRPLTHDLLLLTIQQLGASLQHIEIHDLIEGTYFARLLLQSQEQTLVVDARPSDALALALRAAVRIFIAEQVIEQAGMPIDMIRDVSRQGFSPAVQNSQNANSEDGGQPKVAGPDPAARETLEAALHKAVENEDYERAAELRDALKRLQGE